MRNKILAYLWALVGMIAGLQVSYLPACWYIWIVEHLFHLDKDHKTPVFISTAVVMGLIVIILMFVVFSGRWFYRLFYHDELWGYRPTGDSERLKNPN
jgi:hypothetical protein